MPRTHPSTWKRAEARFAELFACRRQPLSGSSGRDDLTASDTTHARLFCEVKYRASHAARSLWEATRTLARKERKTAVVGLVDRGKPGALIVVHEDDLPELVVEYCAALVRRDPDAADRLMGRIGEARLRLAGEDPGRDLLPADVDPPPDWPPRDPMTTDDGPRAA
jgi:hypothetical protein